MIYYATLKYQETFEVEAWNEDEAIWEAKQRFDPTPLMPELVEVWSDNDE